MIALFLPSDKGGAIFQIPTPLMGHFFQSLPFTLNRLNY